MTVRCFSSTDLPLRQPRRISDLETPAQPSSPGWVTCGGALDPSLGRRRFFSLLHSVRESANYAAQHLTESLGSVAPSIIGFVHVSNMERSNAESVASAYVTERE